MRPTDLAEGKGALSLLSAGVLLLCAEASAQFRYRRPIAIDRTLVHTSPVLDATSSAHTASPSTSLTWSHTTSGGERILIVGVSIQNASGQTVSSVAYGGTGLTRVGSATNGTAARAEIWTLVAPSTGTNDIVVTLSAAAYFAAGAASFTGVHQTTPLGTLASATGFGTSASVAVSSASYELVIDALAQQDETATPSPGEGQVQRWGDVTPDDDDSHNNVWACGSTERGGSSVTMSWTISQTEEWAIAAVPIRPSPTLADYPLLYSVTDPALRSTANGGRVTDPDGDDIIFRALDETTCGGASPCTLDHEIELYEPSTGRLVAWVRIPRLNASGESSDTSIYIYYGNPDISSSTQRKTSVWDAGFAAVWHLAADPGPGGSGDIEDSTSNAMRGTAHASMTSEDLVEAKVGEGIDFDGDDDCVVFPNPLDADRMTVSAWIYATDLSNEWHTVIQRDSESGTWYDFQLYARASDARTENRAVFRIDIDRDEIVDEEAQSDIVLSTSTWYYLVGRYDGAELAFYRDGIFRDLDREAGPIPDSDADVWIARNYVWGEPLEGIIDEVRISTVARSDGWIRTEYNNMNDPGDIGSPGFYAVGDEEDPASAVALVSFSAVGRGDAVLVAWQTASEIDTLGFDLLRAGSAAGPFLRLTDRPIPGLIGSPRGRRYAYLDETAPPGTPLWYLLEEVELDGDRVPHGPICVDRDGDGVPDDRESIAFIRGDVDGDGRIDIADAIRSLSALFARGAPLPCLRAADLDDDGAVALADPLLALGYLFGSGPPPAPPFPRCGLDPTEDGLSCASTPGCAP